MWPETSMLGIDFEVDAKAVANWLPFPLRPARPGRATMLVADYETSVFGAYREVGLILHATLAGLPVRFWAWMVVDDDAAMIFGRELLGVPKKLGTVDISYAADEMQVVVTRNDTTLVGLQVELGDPATTDAPPLMGRWSANVRGSVGMSIPSLIAFETAEQILEARRVSVQASIIGSATDPITALGLGDVVQAFWYRTNFGGTEKLPAVPILPVNPYFLLRHWDLRFS